MKNYSLRILDRNGDSKEFELQSQDLQSLQYQIEAEGGVVLQVRECRAKKMNLRGEELILFCQHIQLMLEAGLPLYDALSALAEESESRQFSLLCRAVADRINTGCTLSQALLSCRIDSFCLAMIKTGEQTGQLPSLLARAAAHLQWREDLRRKIFSALSYPLLIILVLVIIVPLMFVYLVPQLMDFLSGIDATLPWYTKALIATADFSRVHGLQSLLFVVTLIAIAASAWFFSASVRLWADRMYLRAPLLGPLSTQLQTAQLSEQLGIMYSAGVPVADALPLVIESLANRHLKTCLGDVCHALAEGRSLHQGLAAKSFPSMLLRMVSVGEVSGGLDRTLAQAAVFYSRQAHRRADKLAAVVGPLALLVAGLVMVWLVAALILPLYDGLFSMGTGL